MKVATIKIDNHLNQMWVKSGLRQMHALRLHDKTPQLIISNQFRVQFYNDGIDNLIESMGRDLDCKCIDIESACIYCLENHFGKTLLGFIIDWTQAIEYSIDVDLLTINPVKIEVPSNLTI
jgi:hypothetical protein